jgi:GH35 family endo-1,4-beta-xylanase
MIDDRAFTPTAALIDLVKRVNNNGRLIDGVGADLHLGVRLISLRSALNANQERS